MDFNIEKYDPKFLLNLYRKLLKPRLIEEKMLILLRQGKISKWFSGIGQEAISVGAGLVSNKQEYVLPMHRNLGLFTTRGVPLERLFSQFQGKMNELSKRKHGNYVVLLCSSFDLPNLKVTATGTRRSEQARKEE